MGEENKMHNMTTSDYGDGKLSKDNELNASMSLNVNQSADEYTKAIEQIKGNEGQ